MIETFHTIEISDPAFEQEQLRVVTVKSRALERRADVTLWIPPSASIDRLLILLHGVYGSHWVWSQLGGVHRTAQGMLAAGLIDPVVIAMPSDGLSRDGSAYLSFPQGEDVERWIIDEVPAIARLAAPALHAQATVSIAGLSMGGYGALRLGAKYPDRFNSISAHSAITGTADLDGFVEEPLEEYLSAVPHAELQVLYWLKRHSKHLPPLRFDCGIDDGLLESNRALHRGLEAVGVMHIYEEFPGGHEWRYWQEHVSKTLRFAAGR